MIRDAHVSLLRRAIKASGLSNSAFARQVLARDPRQIRRWLSGESKLSKAVLAKLQRLTT